MHLGEFTSLEFLQSQFFSNQTGGTGVDLLAARGTHTFHFLADGFIVPLAEGAIQEINGGSLAGS